MSNNNSTNKTNYAQTLPIELVCEVIGTYKDKGKSHFKLRFNPGVIELIFDANDDYRLKDKLVLDGDISVKKILISTPDLSK